jgi:hypothetical protein
MAALVYQLKITLRDSKPPIWRRVEVSANTSFYLLHCIMQGAMGWMNGHLHQFVKDEEHYGLPSKEDFFEVHDERKFKLSDLLLGEKDWIQYEYDFGDGWEHRVELEKVLSAEKGVKYPRIVKGKNACPPEDCGGIWGYMDLVETLKNRKHPDHASMLEWLGLESSDDFDPTAFDLAARQKELESMYAWGKKMKGREMDEAF